MLEFETLESIANTYIPILAVLSLLMMGKTATTAQWRILMAHATVLSMGLLVAYGLMFIDAQFQLWPSLDLDYSTRTVAFIFVVFLLLAAKRYRLVWVGSLCLYVLLMLYQGYHSAADIFTTAFVVALLLSPVVILFLRVFDGAAGATLNRRARVVSLDAAATKVRQE